MKWFLPLLLTGCSIVSMPDEKIESFILECPECTNVAKRSNIQLVVDNPVMSAALDSQRIAIKTSALNVEYLANVEWARNLSLLIQDSLIQSLQDNFKSVNRPAEGVQSDWYLKLHVHKFHIFKNIAQVEYQLQVMQMPQRQMILNKRIRQHVYFNKMSVSSLNQAHCKAVQEIRGILKSIEKA